MKTRTDLLNSVSLTSREMKVVEPIERWVESNLDKDLITRKTASFIQLLSAWENKDVDFGKVQEHLAAFVKKYNYTLSFNTEKVERDMGGFTKTFIKLTAEIVLDVK